MNRFRSMNLLVASLTAAALIAFAPLPGAGQEKQQKGAKGGKGGKGGGTNGQYGPYYAAPETPGEPVGRTPDGQPDMQGFWTPRFNQAIFEVQDHPKAQPGIAPGKGAIVDPVAEIAQNSLAEEAFQRRPGHAGSHWRREDRRLGGVEPIVRVPHG